MQTIAPELEERHQASPYEHVQERRQIIDSGMDEDIENEVDQVHANQEEDEYPVREAQQQPIAIEEEEKHSEPNVEEEEK